MGGDIYYLQSESISTIPCIDLITMDSLWVEYSWGRFGFIIQNNIWMSIYKGYSHNKQNYNEFYKQVWGSISKNIEDMKDEKSIKLFPTGYYPNTVGFFGTTEEEIGLANFYRHISQCKQQIKG